MTDKSKLWSPETVLMEMEEAGPMEPSLPGMIALFSKDKELFYQLACVGVPEQTVGWAQNCAKFAARFLDLPFKYTGEIIGKENSGYVVWHDELGNMPFEGVLATEVRDFMDTLNGVSVVDPSDKDYKRGKWEGTEVSVAEVYFKHGDPDERKSRRGGIIGWENSVD
jgi:hypothetical protein